jgi:hypothetical protein
MEIIVPEKTCQSAVRMRRCWSRNGALTLLCVPVGVWVNVSCTCNAKLSVQSISEIGQFDKPEGNPAVTIYRSWHRPAIYSFSIGDQKQLGAFVQY